MAAVLVVAAFLVVTSYMAAGRDAGVSDRERLGAEGDRAVSAQGGNATPTPAVAAFVNGEPIYVWQVDVNRATYLWNGLQNNATPAVSASEFCSEAVSWMVRSKITVQRAVSEGLAATVAEVDSAVAHNQASSDTVPDMDLLVDSVKDSLGWSDLDWARYERRVATDTVLIGKLADSVRLSDVTPASEAEVYSQLTALPPGQFVQMVTMHFSDTTSLNAEFEQLNQDLVNGTWAPGEFLAHFVDVAHAQGSLPASDDVDTYEFDDVAGLPDYVRSAVTDGAEGYMNVFERTDGTGEVYLVVSVHTEDPGSKEARARDELAANAFQGAWQEGVDEWYESADISQVMDCEAYSWP